MKNDKRTEQRVLQNIEFYVYIDECTQNPALVGESFDCQATDVSPHGMGISCSEALYKGNLLNITIGAGNPFTLYILKGSVQWINKEDGEYQVGIKLTDDTDSDIERWIQEFDNIFSEDDSPEDELDAFLQGIDD